VTFSKASHRELASSAELFQDLNAVDRKAVGWYVSLLDLVGQVISPNGAW
jgi:hypothetical protein